MIVRRYLAWSSTAAPSDRVRAIRALAQAWLDNELGPEDRREAEAALTVALDDPAPQVRRALAELIGPAEKAPRGIVVGLAQDLPEIAAIVVANSPMLSDADLVDLAALGETLVQTAIASRPHVSVALAAALAEVGDAPALVALVANPGAEIADQSLIRMAERHADDGALSDALLALDDLPVVARLALMGKAAERVVAFVGRCGWLSEPRARRAASEGHEAGAVVLARRAAGQAETLDLVAAMAAAGQLTPQLILRSLLSGDTALLTAALTHLTGVPEARVAAVVNARLGLGFPALYRRAGLPAALEDAFVAALAAVHEVGATGEARLSRAIIERVLTAPSLLSTADSDRLFALLSRYQAEAMRDEARQLAAAWRETGDTETDRGDSVVAAQADDLDRRLAEALAAEIASPPQQSGMDAAEATPPAETAADDQPAMVSPGGPPEGLRGSILRQAIARLGFRRAA